MSDAYTAELKKTAKDNEDYRRVLFTGVNSQLVVMSLEPGEEIGLETHTAADQILYAVKGEGTAIVAGDESEFEKGSVVCVPAGLEHNVVNTGDEPLKLFTIYSPPQHAPGLVQEAKIVEEPVPTTA